MAVVVLGEHDTASEFGRDRTGAGRAPESHEHPDAGSFSVFAYGQRLALDPGYLTFTTHGLVNQPQDHNMVLVDGKGPKDPLAASLGWLGNLAGRPPTDGQSTVFGALDTDGVDRVSVVTRYGPAPITLSRNVQTLADRFVVVLDDVATADGTAHDLAWQLHGNGGGTSGGTFEPQPHGARWTIASGRLDAAFAATNANLTFANRIEEHEVPYTQLSTHVALEAKVRSAQTRMLQVLVPSDATTAPPVITDRSRPGLAAVTATTSDGLRLDAALSSALRPVSDHPAGGPAIDTDGWYAATVHAGSALVSLAVEGATYVRLDGVTLLTTATPGTITMDRSGAGYEVHADGAAPRITTSALGVAPPRSTARAESRRPSPESHRNSCRTRARSCSTPMATPYRRPMPAAIERAVVGSSVRLAGRACDLDDAVTGWSWELVAAPPGSAWRLTGAQSATPTLLADRAGTYRLRLTVTDRDGARSRPSEVVVAAGPRGGDGIDNDLDGRFDTDDTDGDGSDPVDAAIMWIGGTQTVPRVGVAAPDAVEFAWTPGDGPTSLPARVRGSVALASSGAVTFDLQRVAGTYSGSVSVLDAAFGPNPVNVPASQWAVSRLGARALWLDATVRGQTVKLLVGDAPRGVVIGPARG